jgi:hypothetical protein
MSQLLKHYFINRENGEWATDTRFGLMGPNIKGLEIQYNLFTQNEIPYCLSTVPDDTEIVETEGEGLQIFTQQQWDDEIVAYDARQEQKRYNVLRPIRDEILFVTDWIVIKAKEQGTNLTAEFKTWRQALRDLPDQSPFPTGFPTLPSNVQNDPKVLALYARWSEVLSIPMINDPLSLP